MRGVAPDAAIILSEEPYFLGSVRAFGLNIQTVRVSVASHAEIT